MGCLLVTRIGEMWTGPRRRNCGVPAPQLTLHWPGQGHAREGSSGFGRRWSSQDQGPFTCYDQINFLLLPMGPFTSRKPFHLEQFRGSPSSVGRKQARREVLSVRVRSRPGVAAGFEGPLPIGASATHAHTGTQSYMSTDVHVHGLPIQM